MYSIFSLLHLLAAVATHTRVIIRANCGNASQKTNGQRWWGSSYAPCILFTCNGQREFVAVARWQRHGQQSDVCASRYTRNRCPNYTITEEVSQFSFFKCSLCLPIRSENHFESYWFVNILSLNKTKNNEWINKIETNSAYRPWRRPKLTADIQPLRKIFEENPPDISMPSPMILEQPSTGTFFPYLTRTGRLAV